MSLGNCQLSNCNACNTKKIVLETVICYLLFAPQKNRFQKLLYCYIVTLGDGDMDLFL